MQSKLLCNCWLVSLEHQHRAVRWFVKRSSHHQITAFVSRIRMIQVLLTVRGPSFNIVINGVCDVFDVRAEDALVAVQKGNNKGKEKSEQIRIVSVSKGFSHDEPNLDRWKALLEEARQQGIKIEKKVHERFEVVRHLFNQQYQMYRQKVNRIEERIVSLHRPWTRPILRGKTGPKSVEFGPKASLSYVDGFVFLDHLSSENFSEAARVKSQIKQYETLFGKKPSYVVADKIYGNRENRNILKQNEIRDAFQPLGRKARHQNPSTRWRKQKQRERNRIEGSFGHAKNHFDLDKIKYYIENGPEIWIRLGLMGMNLQTAAKRI